MGFKVKGTARLTSMNVRAENHGDEHQSAIDLRFEFEDLPAEALYPILGIAGDGKAQQRFLAGWWGEDGPLLSGLTGAEGWAKFEEGHFLLGGLSAERIDVAKVHKFRFKPTGIHRCDLTFTVAVCDPPEHLITNAADTLKDTVSIEIDHEAELPLEHAA